MNVIILHSEVPPHARGSSPSAENMACRSVPAFTRYMLCLVWHDSAGGVRG